MLGCTMCDGGRQCCCVLLNGLFHRQCIEERFVAIYFEALGSRPGLKSPTGSVPASPRNVPASPLQDLGHLLLFEPIDFKPALFNVVTITAKLTLSLDASFGPGGAAAETPITTPYKGRFINFGTVWRLAQSVSSPHRLEGGRRRQERAQLVRSRPM